MHTYIHVALYNTYTYIHIYAHTYIHIQSYLFNCQL